MPVLDIGPVVGPQGAQGATGPQGERGVQGLPGPNQITSMTSTPLTGVFVGDGSVVNVRAIDTTPTANSTGIPTSGGVKAALDGKAPAGYGLGETSANVITSSEDLNSIPYGGFFRWSSDNIPSNCPISGGGGYLLNMPFNASHASVQILADVANNVLMYRTYSGGWKAWKTITAT